MFLLRQPSWNEENVVETCLINGKILWLIEHSFRPIRRQYLIQLCSFKFMIIFSIFWVSISLCILSLRFCHNISHIYIYLIKLKILLLLYKLGQEHKTSIGESLQNDCHCFIYFRYIHLFTNTYLMYFDWL